MFKRKSTTAAAQPAAEPVSFHGSAFGLPVSVTAPDQDVLDQLRDGLPAAWRDEPAAADPVALVLADGGQQGYALTLAGNVLVSGPLENVIAGFGDILEAHIAGLAPDFIFVHAGAVAYEGRGIVIPGPSFSGKTTLTAALVRAGATYYSDEYAVIDADGNLHPYTKPLALRLREGERIQTDHDVSALGGVAGSDPVRVGMVVISHYRSGGSWEPHELSAADAVVQLVGNTIPVQDRPQQTLAFLRRAVEGATALGSDRGAADAVAADLLRRISST